MRLTLILVFALLGQSTFSQTTSGRQERKGFIFGLGMGVGALSLSSHDTLQTTFSTTLPNIKVGYMINKNLALAILLPGANYKYKEKDRGFEGFQLIGQYWVRNNWWLLGGIGATFDAPAFYTVKDPETADFYFGAPSFSLGTGYEIYHKGKFTVDLQYRIFYGSSNLPDNNQREGISNMFIIGVNWY